MYSIHLKQQLQQHPTKSNFQQIKISNSINNNQNNGFHQIIWLPTYICMYKWLNICTRMYKHLVLNTNKPLCAYTYIYYN